MPIVLNPPSLLMLASRKVAKYIIEGKYNNVDYVLCENGSNIIFDIVKEQKYHTEEEESENIDKVLLRMVRPTRMNFDHHTCRYLMSHEDLSLIREQNLVEFKLGKWNDIEKYIKKEIAVEPPKKRRATAKQKSIRTSAAGDKRGFDFAEFLEDTLSPLTQQNLKKFGIVHYSQKFPFSENWTQSISELLPSLESLDISGQRLTNPEFVTLCNSFPRLLSLEIQETEVTDLTGISKLSSLQHLSIAGLQLENTRCMDELFDMDNLQRLKLCRNGDPHLRCPSNVLKLFVQSKRSLKGLLEIDLSYSSIQEKELRKIIRRHPTLQKVIAFGTDIEVNEIDGTEVLNSFGFPGMLLTLDYLQEREESGYLIPVLFGIVASVHRIPVAQLTTEMLRDVIRKMYLMIPLYEYDERTIGLIQDCCDNLANPNKYHFYENGDKRVLMDSHLMLMDLNRIYSLNDDPRDHVWEYVNTLVRATQDPNTDRIVAKAIEYFFIADGKKWGLKCLEVIDHLLDRIDMKAEYYKGLDKEKLIVGLTKTQSVKHKEMAERVMEFFKNRSA